MKKDIFLGRFRGKHGPNKNKGTDNSNRVYKKKTAKKGDPRPPSHLLVPEGTKEEMNMAYNQSREYQVKLMDYADKDDIPDEVFAQQRRLIHFIKKGPRRGFFVADPRSKITQADVLFILSTKLPSKSLGEKYNVSATVIQNIRQGNDHLWIDEYNLVKRIRVALYGRYKKNWRKEYITVLRDSSTGENIAFFSSKKKAKDYRMYWLMHNQKITGDAYSEMRDSGQMDILYPIEESEVIQD